MKYTIPVSRIGKLEKLINRANRKGANITFQTFGKTIEDGALIINDDINHCQHKFPIKIECVEVLVEGSYKIADWEFVGTIDFTDNGNIIRLANLSFEGKVPSKYLHTEKVCEHCHTLRDRKDTYLIHNTKTDEFKQVGSKCLLDYTQGLDADVCASIMACLEFVDKDDKTIDYKEFTDYNRSNGIYDEEIKNKMVAFVKSNGYNGKITIDKFLDEYTTRNWTKSDMASDEEVKEIDDYADSINLDREVGYLRNAVLAWKKGYFEFRDLGLLLSFIASFLRNKAREIQRKKDLEGRNNTFVGNIGERITFEVKNARVLYTKDNSYTSYYAHDSYVFEIIDTEGHTFIWSASMDNINPEDKITATVKGYKEYKGIKQTVITRGKVEHPWDNRKEEN